MPLLPFDIVTVPPPVSVTVLFIVSTTLLPSVTFIKNVPVLLIVPTRTVVLFNCSVYVPTSVNCPCEAPSSVAPFDAGVSNVPPAFVSRPAPNGRAVN